MALTYLILAVVTISSCIHATTISKPTTLYPNSTNAGHSGTSTTPFCCFAIQETVIEEYWNVFAYSTTVALVNLTLITTLITPYPSTVYTSFKTNVYPTNRTWVFSYNDGRNPISNSPNIYPGPLEIQNEIGNGTQIITAGVTIQSPAAFYVYTTVKIITAAAVTDQHGQVVCGTTSSVANAWAPDVTITDINANAEAYFGGFGIVGKSGTYYTDTAGHKVIQTEIPSGVVISLTTPFIYKPARGANGASGDVHECTGGKEYFGYVPQTVLDFLISNSNYSAQYPGLASCLPGGPSIIGQGCLVVAPAFQANAPDLTESTVVYITPTTSAQPTLKGAYTPNTPTPLSHSSSILPPPISSLTSTSMAESPESGLPNGALPSSPVTSGSTSQFIGLSSVPLPIEESPTGVASSARTIPGKPPIAVPGSSTLLSQSQPIVSIGSTVIPAGSPTGVASSASTIPGKPPIAVPGSPTLPSQSQPIVSIGSTVIPAGSPTGVASSAIPGKPPIAVPGSPTLPSQYQPIVSIGSTAIPAGSPTGVASSASTIPGKPPIAVPGSPTLLSQSQPIVSIGSTLIPASAAILASGTPNGLIGTTTISGTPFLIFPIATPSLSTSLNFPTSVIHGTPFLVISNPTTIPVAGIPSGLGYTTTTISGTPFLVIPSPTMIVASTYQAGPGFPTTIINGTPFLDIPGPTNVPLSLAPSGLSGSVTTYISGSPFLVIPEPTAIPLPTPVSLGQLTLGQLTIISGTTELIINEPTLKPVNLNNPLQGSTTDIAGTTMVIASSANTVSMTGPLQSYAQASAATSNIGRTGIRISLVRLFVGILISRFCLFVAM